jgi:hypothetical protein
MAKQTKVHLIFEQGTARIHAKDVTATPGRYAFFLNLT